MQQPISGTSQTTPDKPPAEPDVKCHLCDRHLIGGKIPNMHSGGPFIAHEPVRDLACSECPQD